MSLTKIDSKLFDMSEPSSPPAYTESNLATAKMHTITFQLHEPGRINKRTGCVFAGKQLETRGDAFLLVPTMKYGEFWCMLEEKIKKQFRIDNSSATYEMTHEVKGTAVVKLEGVRDVVITTENWGVVKEMLDTQQGARLTFIFAEVPHGYKGPSKEPKGKCVVQ